MMVTSPENAEAANVTLQSIAEFGRSVIGTVGYFIHESGMIDAGKAHLLNAKVNYDLFRVNLTNGLNIDIDLTDPETKRIVIASGWIVIAGCVALILVAWKSMNNSGSGETSVATYGFQSEEDPQGEVIQGSEADSTLVSSNKGVTLEEQEVKSNLQRLFRSPEFKERAEENKVADLPSHSWRRGPYDSDNSS